MRSGFIALFRVGLVAVLLGLPIAAIANAPDPGQLGKRVALVVGNGAYGDLGRLPNPPNDASDIAAKLRALHFDVTLVTDGDAEAMLAALRDFGEAGAGADVALFFYAGHGMAMEGENYLIPVRARIKDKLSLRYGALSLSDVRDTLESTDAPLKMVILDACRDNPLAKQLQQSTGQLGRSLDASSGLARMNIDQGSGWYIAFATGPGRVALDGKNQRNSPFTQALLAHVGDENVDARVMFGSVRDAVVRATEDRQNPWSEDGMRGQFQFNPVAVKPAEPVAPTDYLDWQKISSSDEPSDYEAFLKAHPDSNLASAAEARIRQLRDPATERATWDLTQSSSDPAAYEKFLRNYPEGPYAGAARLNLQNLLGAQLRSSDDRHAMEEYIARFPNSPFTADIDQRLSTLGKQAMAAPAAPTIAPAAPAAEADRALELVAAPTPPPSPSAAPEADLSPDSVARLRLQVQGIQIQYALKALGYYTGKVDGKLGSGSQRAISSFQRSIGAQATGDLLPEEIVALVGAAARGGNRDAQTIYGVLFQTGAGVKKDQARAVEWYRRAAEGGNGYGQLNLGFAYANGWGVERDVVSARRWLEAANASGVPEARQALRTLGD